MRRTVKVSFKPRPLRPIDADENLDPLLVSLNHSSVHANAVANFETVGVALLLLFFDEIENTIHNYAAYAAARLVGGHFQSAGLEMQMGKMSILRSCCSS